MSWIPTYTGAVFSLTDPDPATIHIEDIAHHLAYLCRYAGATRSFYSVAQHSVLVSLFCAPEHARAGLMHDAPEAYCLDMPRPLKYLPGMEQYRAIEKRIWSAICKRFDIAPVLPESVKHTDVALLMTERQNLLGPQHAPWDREVAPLEIPDFDAWSPERAEREFLHRFAELEAKRLITPSTEERGADAGSRCDQCRAGLVQACRSRKEAAASGGPSSLLLVRAS